MEPESFPIPSWVTVLTICNTIACLALIALSTYAIVRLGQLSNRMERESLEQRAVIGRLIKELNQVHQKKSHIDKAQFKQIRVLQNNVSVR